VVIEGDPSHGIGESVTGPRRDRLPPSCSTRRLK
jgi:hypothetical protein